jgi:hypothetical protein
MGANITMNGHSIGSTLDQFLRYTYDVTTLLNVGPNVYADLSHTQRNTLHFGPLFRVTVTFTRDINTTGRFMACTGGIALPQRVSSFSTHCTRLGLGTF